MLPGQEKWFPKQRVPHSKSRFGWTLTVTYRVLNVQWLVNHSIELDQKMPIGVFFGVWGSKTINKEFLFIYYDENTCT